MNTMLQLIFGAPIISFQILLADFGFKTQRLESVPARWTWDNLRGFQPHD